MVLFITFIRHYNVFGFFCNMNHCNDSAPCWNLDWTIKSYLILSYRVDNTLERGMHLLKEEESSVAGTTTLDRE